MPGEQCWIYICGSESPETTICYLELFFDVALVLASKSISNVLVGRFKTNDQKYGQEKIMDNFHIFFEFTLLYFSIVNGWFLYAHHFASRFIEVSRMNSIFLFVYLYGILYGVYNASMDTSQEFSIAMIIQRMTIFFMIARIGLHVPRTGPFCGLFGFVTVDSILCFTLAATDPSVVTYLWSLSALIEFHLDLFLAVTLAVPFDIYKTMDKSCVLMAAPLGSLVIAMFTDYNFTADPLLLISSIVLLSQLLLLYLILYPDACYATSRLPQFIQTFLIMFVKLLGWTFWTIGASLILTSTLQTEVKLSSRFDLHFDSQQFAHKILGYSVGCALFLLFAIRLVSLSRLSSSPSTRPYSSSTFLDILWILHCWIPFATVKVLEPTEPLLSISIYLGVSGILCFLEAWTRYHINSPPPRSSWRTTTTTSSSNDAQPLLSNANVPVYTDLFVA